MAYSESLANRIRDEFLGRTDVREKKMFGGLCFMVAGNMCCGIVGEKLMARVGPDQYESCLKKKHVTLMDFTGKSMTGMVYVEPEGIKTQKQLLSWLETCLSFISTLPAK